MSRKLDKARAALDSAEQTVTEWCAKADGLAAQLAEAEATVGVAALETGDLEGAARRVADLREQVAGAHATVAAAEAQRDAAQRDVLLAEADDLRAEAQGLDAHADEHAARTSELLDALEEHEGGRYVPEQPHPGTASAVRLWTPRTDQFRNQANVNRRKADDLERQAQRLGPGAPEAVRRAPGRAATAA